MGQVAKLPKNVVLERVFDFFKNETNVPIEVIPDRLTTKILENNREHLDKLIESYSQPKQQSSP